MPRDKTKPSYGKPRAGPSTLPGGISKPKSLAQRDPEGLPGVSKIKASIRQTERFLRKDNLEAGLRVQTERRLASLQGDLAKAERRALEMRNGTKYHKAKFFERQKLTRLIKRFQKASSGEDAKGKSKAGAESDLEKARIMLNYVVHFPHTERYISLFPRDSGAQGEDDDLSGSAHLVLPPHLDEPVPDPKSLSDQSARRRLELLVQMRDLMRDGKISSQPELLDKDGRAVKVDALSGGSGTSVSRGAVVPPPDEAAKKSGAGTGADAGDGSSGKKKKKGKKGKEDNKVSTSLADQDDFFETD